MLYSLYFTYLELGGLNMFQHDDAPVHDVNAISIHWCPPNQPIRDLKGWFVYCESNQTKLDKTV